MHIMVKGKNLEVPDNIRDEAIAKLSKVEKLFDRLFEMEVVFSQDHNPRIEEKVHCEVVLHAKGKTMRATAVAPDPLTAIDRAQARIIRQVREYKAKLIDRSRTNNRATSSGVVEESIRA